jgi:hypothetical protein
MNFCRVLVFSVAAVSVGCIAQKPSSPVPPTVVAATAVKEEEAPAATTSSPTPSSPAAYPIRAPWLPWLAWAPRQGISATAPEQSRSHHPTRPSTPRPRSSRERSLYS